MARGEAVVYTVTNMKGDRTRDNAAFVLSGKHCRQIGGGSFVGCRWRRGAGDVS